MPYNTIVKPTLRKLKKHLPELWWYSMMMFIFARAGDIIQLIIGLFIVPLYIPKEELGAILPITSLTLFISLPMMMTMTTAVKYITVFDSRNEPGKIKSLFKHLMFVILLLSVVSIGIIFSSRHQIQEILKFDNSLLIIVIAAITVFNCWLPLANQLSQGVKNFKVLIFAKLLGPCVRLVIILLTIASLELLGYFLASLALQVVTVAYLLANLRRFLVKDVPAESYREEWLPMLKYFVPTAFATALMVSLNMLEPSSIRALLPPEDSAGYFIISMFARIPQYITPGITLFLFPLVAQAYEKGESTAKMHIQSLLAILIIGTGLAGLFHATSSQLLSLQTAWHMHAHYGKYLSMVTLIITMKCVMLTHINHESACRNFNFLWYLAPAIIAEALILIYKPDLLAGLDFRGAPNAEAHLQLIHLLRIMFLFNALPVLGIIIQLMRRFNMNPSSI